MARERGLVVDCTGHKITVVTRDGRFQTFDSRKDVLIGEEVFIPPINRKTHLLWLVQRRVIPAIAIASLLVFISFFGYSKYLEARPAMAYVALDLAQSEGSIELEVNDKGLVKSAVSYDETGQKALSQISYKMKPVEKVAQEFVSKGATANSSGLIMGIVPVKETPQVAHLEKSLKNTLSKTASQITSSRTAQATNLSPSSGGTGQGDTSNPGETAGNVGETQRAPGSFQVEVMNIDLETRSMAQELGISAVKAVIWALAENMKESLGLKGQEPKSPSEASKDPGKVASFTEPLVPSQGSTAPGKGHGEHSGSTPPKGSGGSNAPATPSGSGSSKGSPGLQSPPGSQGSGKSQGTGDSSGKSGTSGGSTPSAQQPSGQGSGNDGVSGGQGKGTQGPSQSSPSFPWKKSPFPTKGLEDILKAAAEKDTKALRDLTKNLLEEIRRSLQEGGRGGGVRFIRASVKQGS